MKTYGEVARSSNAAKAPRTLKSALTKKKSRGPKVKKNVRFDLRKRLTPSDEALFEECLAQCKRTGFNRPSYCNETQLKSHSCEDVVCSDLADCARPWQSLTCLAPPSSPTNPLADHCSSCVVGAASPTGSLRPQILRGILRRPKFQNSRRFLSCKERISTPRWARNSTQIVQTRLPIAHESLMTNSIAHSSIDFCEENLKLTRNCTASYDNHFKLPVLIRQGKDKCIGRNDKFHGNDRRFGVEDLSTNIERLQIATKNASRHLQLEDVSVKANKNVLHESNDYLDFVAMDSCVNDSQEELDLCDYLRIDNDGSNDNVDKNNSSVERGSNQEKTSNTHVSTKNDAVVLSSNSHEELDTVTSQSSTGRTITARDGEDFAATMLTQVHPNCSSTARNEPSSSSIQTSIDFLLEGSYSADFVVSETLLASSTVNQNFEFLVDPEEEIDEDFWMLVCSQNSSDNINSQSTNCRFCFDEPIGGETAAIENDEETQKKNKQSNDYDQGPSRSCDTANLNATQAHNKNHSNAPACQAALHDHGLYALPSPFKIEAHLAPSVTQTCSLVPMASGALSTLISNHQGHDREPLQDDADASDSSCGFVYRVRQSASEPASICGVRSTVKAKTNSSKSCMKSCHKNSEAARKTDVTAEEEDNNPEQNIEEAQRNAEDKERPLLMCCVLNCGLQFSQPSLLNAHVAQMNHSPCNPLATLLDGLEPPGDPRFLCPRCGNSFEAS
ncbi:hypothetical protein EGW08_014468 [Elysia chlorotica]|uniref:C2H2-type domain-containing protein n=1 Tax=Elysia chlorotica TaxID=188477 RepID=A0A433T868_ELYCH|nr:hypothetical protein EGW08_014468 [Elysia chlorotica]